MISFPPNFRTSTIKKGRIILYPKVPIKFTSNSGKMLDCKGGSAVLSETDEPVELVFIEEK
jgi:hypothetical protein